MLIDRGTREKMDSFFGMIKLRNRSNIDTACKIEQVLAYLEIIHAVIRKYSKSRTITMVDCCAGNCYLGFLVCYFYMNIEKRNVIVHCVDKNETLMNRSAELAAELGFENIHFHSCDVMEFTMNEKPDMVFSLHACDLSTDRAIYCGLKNGSRSILTVSCCQHTILKNFRNPRYRGITRHKIFRDRIGYMVGDSLRAIILEMHGYDTDIIEFVSSRYTDKNIMIRAVKGGKGPGRELAEDYDRISREFRVRPELELYLKGED